MNLLAVGSTHLYRDRLGQGTKSAADASAPQAQQSPQPPPTIASTVDREISTIEKEIVEAAEAMREDKFNFSPGELDIPGDDYKVCARLPCRSSMSPLPTIPKVGAYRR